MKQMTDNTTWLYINTCRKEGENYSGSLLHFIVGRLHWELNFRGDFPGLRYHTNDTKHVLQIDGDLYYPVEVKRSLNKFGTVKFDAYRMPMNELLRFINTILYEDMELEYDEDEKISGNPRDDYEVFYEEDNNDGFNRFLEKLGKQEEILEEDVKIL
jgi:hypothetical protein